jgi:hypothetical protein
VARPRGDFDKGKERLLLKLQALGQKLWPSNAFLARELDCSVRQIERYIAALIKEGRLRRVLSKYFKYGKILTKRFLVLVKKVGKAIFGVPIYRDQNEKPMDTSVDPQITKALADEEVEERRRQAVLADTEFQRKKHERSGLRHMVHMALGGYRRPVRHSPSVQLMLNDLDRRLKESKR